MLAAINVETGKLYGTFDPSGERYLNAYNTVLAVGSGNYELSGSFIFLDTMYNLYGTFLIALIMFNILIALISDTYALHQEQRELKDLAELVNILDEFAGIMKFMNMLYCGLFTRKKKYLHFSVAKVEEDGKYIFF